MGLHLELMIPKQIVSVDPAGGDGSPICQLLGCGYGLRVVGTAAPIGGLASAREFPRRGATHLTDRPAPCFSPIYFR